MIYGIMLLMIGLKLKMSVAYYLLLGAAAMLEVARACKSCCEKQVNLLSERRHHEV